MAQKPDGCLTGAHTYARFTSRHRTGKSMSVGIQVGAIISEIGAPSFLNAFFSTVAGLLENDAPGSRFPVVSSDFYDGHIDADKVASALAELKVIRAELMRHPPTAIIWDIEDRSNTPPWGDVISTAITSMGNYFVSSTGRDLFELLNEVLQHAVKHRQAIDIV
jgi:hypothetical protein